jgi:uncharacterized repeat protein (TIGR03803 family)
MRRTIGVSCFLILLTATARPVSAQVTFEILKSFIDPSVDTSGTTSANPAGPMVQTDDGWIYGLTTRGGGMNDTCASAYRFYPSDAVGTFQTLWTGAQGNTPDGINHGCYVADGGLVKAGDGNLYFTTLDGGWGNAGLIHRITPGASVAPVHEFLSPVAPPLALFSPGYGLAVGADGALYGVTFRGGTSDLGGWFRFRLDGTFSVIASVPPSLVLSNNDHQRSALVAGTDGRLYGTASNDASESFVYRLDPESGMIDILHGFLPDPDRGIVPFPIGRLVEVPPLAGQDIAFIGVTRGGGSNSPPVLYRVDMSAASPTFAQLFLGGFGSLLVKEGLVRDNDGTLYGATWGGTIFRMGPDGVLSILSTLPELQPFSPLLIGADGNLYGTSYGPFSSTPGGYIFRLTLPGTAKTNPIITWPTPADMTYGTALGPTQLNATADVDGAFAYTPSTGTYLQAGAGQSLSAEFAPADGTRYSDASAIVHINVNPATLQLTTDNLTKVVGAANPPLSYNVSGFVLGETTAVLSGTPEVSTTATTASPVGTYPIVVSFGTLSAANYSFAFGNGTLTVVYAGAGSTCLSQPGHAVLSPINADGTSVFKRNSSVAVKFRVCDANGASIGTPGVVSSFNLVQVIAGTTSQVVNETVDSTNPDGAFRWDATGQQWIFHVATKNLSADKTYVFRIMLNDGSAIDFGFGVR